jgi:hypothetical protein
MINFEDPGVVITTTKKTWSLQTILDDVIDQRIVATAGTMKNMGKMVVAWPADLLNPKAKTIAEEVHRGTTVDQTLKNQSGCLRR